ncbi:hypothetical protein TRFO_24828 [Tritrichomonas foetus]|uniref:RUN domain-containing protein n=1 Tax=Tritrichomonas foetus TaxID=1144522 RepID=A0A1J4KBE9_9EUKA|nr:hypothetical protein TRFO_24828 [Tritrichomonas foetus]|eukprot:OHT07012.1 hypothetical protein TRFO_24828 [Tritrichomonas foetus]
MTQQVNLSFPDIFSPLVFKGKEWENIDCKVSQGKVHSYRILPFGPFFFLTPIKRKNHSLVFFIPNYTPNSPIKVDRSYQLHAHPQGNLLPSFIFISTNETYLKEIKEYMISAITDMWTYLSTMKIDKPISKEIEQYNNKMPRPIAVHATIQYTTGKFKFQTLNAAKAEALLDLPLGQGTVIVSPCTEVPSKLGGSDNIMNSFLIFVNGKSDITYFKVNDINEMIEWILFIYAYSNRMVTTTAKPAADQTRAANIKSTKVPPSNAKGVSKDGNNKNVTKDKLTRSPAPEKDNPTQTTPKTQKQSQHRPSTNEKSATTKNLQQPKRPQTNATPKGTTPKDTTPKGTTPKGTAPKDTTQKETAPKDTTQNGTTPKETTQKDTTPKITTQKGTTQKGTAPKETTQKDTAPKETTPQTIPSSSTTTPSANTSVSTSTNTTAVKDSKQGQKTGQPGQKTHQAHRTPQHSAQKTSSKQNQGQQNKDSDQNINTSSTTSKPQQTQTQPNQNQNQDKDKEKETEKESEQPKQLENELESKKKKENEKQKEPEDFAITIESIVVQDIEPSPEVKKQLSNIKPATSAHDKHAQTRSQNNVKSKVGGRKTLIQRRGSMTEASYNATLALMDQETGYISEDANYDIPKEAHIEERLAELEKRYSKTDTFEIFIPPSFDEILGNARYSVTSVNLPSTRPLQIKTLMESIAGDESEIIDFPFVDEPDEKIVENTLNEILCDERINLSDFFNFREFPEFDESSLQYADKPIIPFFKEFTDVDEGLRMTNKTVHDQTEPYAMRFCSLIGCVLLNGLRDFTNSHSTINLADIFTEIAEGLSELKPMITEMRTENTTVAQASIAASILIKKNMLCTFLREVNRNDTWTNKYYLPSSIFANYEFVETFVLTLEQILNKQTFNIEVSSNIINHHSEDFIKFALTPLFAYLEIDELTNPECDPVRVIARQFEVGLKRKGKIVNAIVKASPWDMLSSLAQIPNDSSLWQDFVSSITTIKKISSGTSKLEDWLRENLNRHMLHIWFLIIVVNKKNIESFYDDDSSLIDPFRAKYVAKKIYNYLKAN